MYLPDIMYLIASVATIVVGVVLIWVVSHRVWLYNRHKELYKKSLAEHEKAHDEAEEIVEEASEEAQAVLKKTHLFTRESKEQLKRTLKQVTTDAEERLKKLLDETEKDLSSISSEIVKLYQEEWQRSLAQTRETHAAQLQEMAQDMRHVIENELVKTRKEMDEFKKRKQQEVVDELASQAERALEKVIGRSIPLEVQEDLVLQAMEEAADEKILKS